MVNKDFHISNIVVITPIVTGQLVDKFVKCSHRR